MMNIFAINEARKPPRIGRLATASGALLCTMGAVGPALSADLPYGDTPYGQGYYWNGYYNNDYAGYNDCYSYYYYRCDYCCAWRQPVPQRAPVVERVPAPWVAPQPVAAVSERYWSQRDYAERSYYPYYYTATRYAYPPPSYSQYAPYPPPHAQYAPYPPNNQYTPYPPPPYHYSSYHPGPGGEGDRYADYRAPHRDLRRPPDQAGFQYPPYAAAYEYQADPHNPDRYVDATRSPYDYGGYRPEYEYRPPNEHEHRPPTRGPNYGPGYYGSAYSEQRPPR